MVDSDAPVSQFVGKIAELNKEKERLEGRLHDLSAPYTAISLHPAAQELHLGVVAKLAAAIREETSALK